MRNSLAKLMVVGMCLAGAASGAQAEVIDFNGLAGTNVPGSTFVASGLYTYVESGPSTVAGFQFETLGEPHWYAGDINATIFCNGSNIDCAKNGTDYLLSSNELKVKRVGAGTFNLKGLDLDNFRDGGEDFIALVSPLYFSYPFAADDTFANQTSFLITGFLANGGIVNQTLTLDAIANRDPANGGNDFNHFSLTGFDNITSFNVQWLGATTSNNSFALDNLDVSVNAVPEPTSLALLGIGLLGLARSRRQSRRADA